MRRPPHPPAGAAPAPARRDPRRARRAHRAAPARRARRGGHLLRRQRAHHRGARPRPGGHPAGRRAGGPPRGGVLARADQEDRRRTRRGAQAAGRGHGCEAPAPRSRPRPRPRRRPRGAPPSLHPVPSRRAGMISTVRGVLADRAGETVVIETDGGVGYAVTAPLGVFERLPDRGGRCALHTELVVREDGWTLYGFDSVVERAIFQRLLSATGLGPRLALAILSTLGPERAVRSIRARDVAALSTVSGIGKKRAEKLIVELSDRVAGR